MITAMRLRYSTLIQSFGSVAEAIFLDAVGSQAIVVRKGALRDRSFALTLDNRFYFRFLGLRLVLVGRGLGRGRSIRRQF